MRLYSGLAWIKHVECMHEKSYLQTPCVCQAWISVQKSIAATAVAFAANTEVLQLMVSSLSSLMAHDQIQLVLLSRTCTDETSGMKNTTANSSFLIWAYLISSSDKDLEAQANGLLSSSRCCSQAWFDHVTCDDYWFCNIIKRHVLVWLTMFLWFHWILFPEVPAI